VCDLFYVLAAWCDWLLSLTSSQCNIAKPELQRCTLSGALLQVPVDQLHSAIEPYKPLLLCLRTCLQTDKTNAGDTAEKTLENALWALKQEIKHHTPNVQLKLHLGPDVAAIWRHIFVASQGRCNIIQWCLVRPWTCAL